MGCADSKPEVEVDLSIEACYLKNDAALRTAVEEGRIDWTEKLHKFSDESAEDSGAMIKSANYRVGNSVAVGVVERACWCLIVLCC